MSTVLRQRPEPGARSPRRRIEPERRFVLHGVTWEQYLAIRKAFADRPGVRLTYDQGLLEFMSPSADHENYKTKRARLLEHYAFVTGIRLYGYGSTTYKKKSLDRGLEPDECYFVGDDDRSLPDFAIEVALSSGGIPKLPVYQGLGVREVWLWRRDALEVHARGRRGFERVDRSRALPDLDLVALARCVRIPDQVDALHAWDAFLQRDRGGERARAKTHRVPRTRKPRRR
jgi:Uma2 family endonuclease